MSSQEDGRKPEHEKEDELSPEELGQVAGGITFVFTPNTAGLINETGDTKYINEQLKTTTGEVGYINEQLK
jgi:hypothetical protein